MGFATTDNSKSVRSTSSIFVHKKNIGVTIEKIKKKNEISKFWSLWVLPSDGSVKDEKQRQINLSNWTF